MTKIESIAEALLIEGYLSRENVEAAVALLTQYLSAVDQEKYWEVEDDYSPPSRFVKAVVLSNTVRPLHTGEDAT